MCVFADIDVFLICFLRFFALFHAYIYILHFSFCACVCRCMTLYKDKDLLILILVVLFKTLEPGNKTILCTLAIDAR